MDTMEKLRAWLERHNARCNWRHTIGPTLLVEGHTINGRIVLVQIYEYSSRLLGWDIYVQAADTNDIVETFEAAEVALGLRTGLPPIERPPVVAAHDALRLFLDDDDTDPEPLYDARAGLATALGYDK